MDQTQITLQKAVLDGKDVHMVIDLAACQAHGTDMAGPTVKGGVRFDAYMVQADGTIAFAMTHFTVRPDKTAVSEFLSYRARERQGRSAHPRSKPCDICSASRVCIRLRHWKERYIPLVRRRNTFAL
jgi:VirK protein